MITWNLVTFRYTLNNLLTKGYGLTMSKRQQESDPFDLQFKHAGSQSGAIKAENFRCPALAAHFPIGGFKDF